MDLPAHPAIPPTATSGNLTDYAQTRADFTWDIARTWLDGLPAGGINIAHEAVDRHVPARGEQVALRFLGGEEMTYAQLAAATSRWANALQALGISPGETLFSLIGRDPALYVGMLGAFKAQVVFAPLFSAFGPEPIRQRMTIGEGVALLTTAALYRKKIGPIRDELPHLRHVILADGPADDIPEAIWFDELLADHPDTFDIRPTYPQGVALLHFTSGTTGTPKAAVHVHEAVVAHNATAHFALDLRAEDVYWCTADPGWVTGTSYGVIAPLVHGVTSIVDPGEFDARRWYRTLAEQRVTVWYTAPTAIRMLMRAGPDAMADADLSALRFVASVGEPLNPEAVLWGRLALERTIHDNWWQTETGGIMIANYPTGEVYPGSMGRPVPGITATVLRRGESGRAEADEQGRAVELGPGQTGELALRAGWPSMFRGYLGQPERYARCFLDGWYLTGDLAQVDERGYYWFVGRADDVIKSAGHLIGPFEVESVLMEDPRVAEAGVIGVPDELVGERVKAFVCLKPGVAGDAAMRRDLMALARRRLGPSVAPRDIAFTPSLPHTRSGKIMRRLLRARELGMPEGDLSTLETL